MNPSIFRAKWTGHELKERSAAQEHFLDLCRLLGHPTPAEADPAGESFCFEKGAEKTGGEKGWADVWKRGFFGWEYKGPRADLDDAYMQLLQYREALENPPLLVVCDTDRIVIHTNFTNTVKHTHTIRLQNIERPESLQLLRHVFRSPEALKPGETPEHATEEAAAQIAAIAELLRARGVPPHDAAHFLMKLIFCLFAEDVDLLPAGAITALMRDWRREPDQFGAGVRELFAIMRTGGRWGSHRIDHFDGGLFDDDATIPLEPDEIAALARVGKLDWSQVEPAVFGTLFERSLDPAKRAQLGAHYTSREDIETIIEPVLMAPLRAEWEQVRARCDDIRANGPTARREQTNAKINAEVSAFMDRIASVRVLDPACGSGNFLYVSLRKLKDLEKEVYSATAMWGAQAPFPRVDPAQLYGLEIDPYAAELARLTVWIGYLQWMRFNGFTQVERPILKPLDNIREQDAIMALVEAPAPVNVVESSGQVCMDQTRLVPSEPAWPETDIIVGNPPFLGDKKPRRELGDEYVERLFSLYRGRIPNQSDLCCYWFERARAEIERGHAKRAGLLATNSIRQGRNRVVLGRILQSGGIFWAISNREWILEGAAVRTSMVGFDDGSQTESVLDGRSVERINPDLTAHADVTRARRLRANRGIGFVGTTKKGPFDIPGDLARRMLAAANPLGRNNADVVKPWWNGYDIVRRPQDMWIIDFGDMPVAEAALYEMPFEYVKQHVLPLRRRHREKRQEQFWWLLARPCPDMRRALSGLPRYAVTPRVMKHRLFAWVPADVTPDCRLNVFARADDYLFGVLQSRPHCQWALSTGSTLEDRPTYTPQTCFETFPFPEPTAEQREAIAEAARRLHEVRQSALDGDPKLTLTALYNSAPTWLSDLHQALDEAVLTAYGWPADISDDELLERLLELNLQRAEDEERGVLVRP